MAWSAKFDWAAFNTLCCTRSLTSGTLVHPGAGGGGGGGGGACLHSDSQLPSTVWHSILV